MKYPKKHNGEDIFLKLPIKDGKVWNCAFLTADGKVLLTPFARHLTFSGCVNCCNGYNRFHGYSRKKVAKIIKHFEDVKKEEKQ